MANASVVASPAASMFDENDARFRKLLDHEVYNAESVYNVPGFKPVHKEVRHGPVTITGALPKDLEGVYVRNGTNPQFDPLSSRYHMFGGAGMLPRPNSTRRNPGCRRRFAGWKINLASNCSDGPAGTSS